MIEFGLIILDLFAYTTKVAKIRMGDEEEQSEELSAESIDPSPSVIYSLVYVENILKVYLLTNPILSANELESRLLSG